MKDYIKALAPLPLWRLSKNDVIHVVVAIIIVVVSLATQQVWIVALSPMASVLWGPPARWGRQNPAFPRWHTKKEAALQEAETKKRTSSRSI